MRVAIMQPTYLPWAGYFSLMHLVDRFVFLDSVQFARRSWQQRNRVKTGNGVQWLTVPVRKKGRRNQKIIDVEIKQSSDFPGAHLKAIEMAYHRAPYYDLFGEKLASILLKNHAFLCELNIVLIQWIASELGITTEFYRSSRMAVDGSKAALLADICEKLDADEYISPPGSRDYMLASDEFQKRNISVKYHEYEHPVYPQQYEGFEPYLSVIDLLFNCGAQSLKVLSSGARLNG